MEQQNCIFCKIVTGVIPAQKIKETEDIIVIKDIAPKAPVHYLIIPKKHIANIQSATHADQKLLGAIILMSKDLSQELADPQEYRLVSNNGASVGQSVFHIHFHFLAGKQLAEQSF